MMSTAISLHRARHPTPDDRTWRGRLVGTSLRRRRLLGSLTGLGLTLLASGCQVRLPLISTPAGTPRASEPTPLPPAEPPAAPGTHVRVTFGRVVCLEGVTVERESVQPGEYLRVWLYWRSEAPAQEDLRSIGRLVAGAGRVVASEDDQIGRRRRLLSRWQVGEQSVDEMRLRVTRSTAPGEYSLVVGVLRPDNQTAVPLSTRVPAASTWHEDGVVVGTIEVAAG